MKLAWYDCTSLKREPCRFSFFLIFFALLIYVRGLCFLVNRVHGLVNPNGQLKILSFTFFEAALTPFRRHCYDKNPKTMLRR